MLLKQIHGFISMPLTQTSRVRLWFWLGLSLLFALFFGFMGLQTAFNSAYVVQDDARQHVFWMQRFLDPELFPNDWIADYFQASAPAGYTNFYRFFANLGINPLLLSKLLPVFLGLVVTWYCFWLSLQMLPVPFGAFLATLFLNQNLWVQDDLISGTPRAFLMPIFVPFLYYLVRRALVPCLITIALQGLFYPSYVFIMSGILILRLLHWDQGLKFSKNRQDYVFCAAGLVVAFLVLLPYALDTSQYGPIITAAEAKTLPEFSMSGRTIYFVEPSIGYWLFAKRSGIFLLMMPLCLLSGWLLPYALRQPRSSLKQRVRHISLLVQMLVAALGMFCLAHATLFRLYLPGRYTQFSLQVITALAAAIAVTILLDKLLTSAEEHAKTFAYRRYLINLSWSLLLGIVILTSPILLSFANASKSYVVGEVPSLYEFFTKQPKDIVIASLAQEADNLPTFSRRSVLVSMEYSIPYEKGYYGPIRQRATDLIRAQYSPNLSEVKQFIQKYKVDFWMIDKKFMLTPNLDQSDTSKKNAVAQMISKYFERKSATELWINQFQPVAREANTRYQQGKVPALAKLVDRCSVFAVDDLVVLQAKCLIQADQN